MCCCFNNTLKSKVHDTQITLMIQGSCAMVSMVLAISGTISWCSHVILAQGWYFQPCKVCVFQDMTISNYIPNESEILDSFSYMKFKVSTPIDKEFAICLRWELYLSEAWGRFYKMDHHSSVPLKHFRDHSSQGDLRWENRIQRGIKIDK